VGINSAVGAVTPSLLGAAGKTAVGSLAGRALATPVGRTAALGAGAYFTGQNGINAVRNGVATAQAIADGRGLDAIEAGILTTENLAGFTSGAKALFAKPRAVSSPTVDWNNPRLKVLNEYCFAPETLIATPAGPRPIGEIRRGDTVLAYDHRTGEWRERQVAKFHESIFEGPLVTITTDSGPIRATVYHPFWVTSGRDLDERSTPRELAEEEDQGFALPGRWVNSHELRCGDVLISRDGKSRTVLRIEQEFKSGFLVHNLTIDQDHTFAVGEDAVLVHNTGGCPGAYTNTHTSGKTYTGKGPIERMNESAARIAKQYNDPIMHQDWTPAANWEDAFVQEALRLRAHGGPGGNTYNIINSPGESILDELGI
jgi:hypothetical protein